MDSKGKTHERKEILRIIDEIAEKASDGKYIYRGQPDAAHLLVSSTLYRVMEKYCLESGGNEWGNMNIDMNLIQKEVLKAAQDFANYNNDEMLSRIQHYSGDTNLIDFTKDYLVALFFACSQQYGKKEDGGKDGKVFLLEISNLKDSEIKMITPVNPPNRVIAQKSIFIQPRTGIIPEDMKDVTMKVVTIDCELKQPILSYLETRHDISSSTIYNDLHGYVRNRKDRNKAIMEFYLGVYYADKR